MSLTQIADDQLLADLVFAWRGNWTLDQIYPRNHLVRADGSVFISKVNQSQALSTTRPNTGENWQLCWDLFVERGTGVEVSRVVRENPTGLLNNLNTVFTLAFTPVNGTEEVFFNGMLQNPGAENDYVLSGQSITFNFTPISTDCIRVSYVKA